MRLSLPKLLFLTIFIAVTGCSETIIQPLAEIPLESPWTLTHLDGKPVPAKPPVTATITGDNISIKGPVNRINGSLNDGKLGPMMSTKMAGPPELMKYEQKLLTALEGATLKPIDANTLKVQKADKTVAILKKKPGDPSD